MTNNKHNINARKGGKTFENETIKRLKERIDWCNQQVHVQRDYIEQVNEEIVKVQSKILQQRKARMATEGGMSAQDHGTKTETQIRITERRLNLALVKFNEKIAYNKQLRERIDELRRERVVYDRIYTNIERELHEQGIEMKEIIMDGYKTTKERDKHLSELETLKEQVKETTELLEDEKHELSELLKKMRAEKEKEIENLDEKRNHTGHEPMVMSKEAEPRSLLGLKRNETIVKTRTEDRWNAADYELNSAGPTADFNQETGEDIAGSADVESMLADFHEVEEKNFSLFNHISELNLEKEHLEKDIMQTNREIEALAKKSLKSYNVSSGLESKTKRMEAKANDNQEKCKVAEQLSISFKAAIKDVFYQIQCDTFVSGANELLGGTVTDSNVMQYLAIIEQVSPDRHNTFKLQELARGVAEIGSLRSYTSISAPRISFNITPTAKRMTLENALIF